MSEPFWQTKFKGTPIRIGLGDLSLRRLMEMKARSGEAYGIPTEFINLLLRGDMVAMQYAVWIGQQKAGGPIDNLDDMDFTLDDFEALEDPPKPKGSKKAKGNPTPEGSSSSDSAPGASTTSDPSTSTTSST